MKKKIISSLIIIFLMCGGFYLKNQHINNIKEICTGNNIEAVSICIQQGRIFPQQQYDLFYNLAINNPPISLLTNNYYYEGFNLARYHCKVHSEQGKCNLHDDTIFEKTRILCVNNSDNLHNGCIDSYFNSAKPTKENVEMLINLMQKINNKDATLDCMGAFKYFYNKLSDDLKKEVPLDIQQSCSQK